MTLGLILLGLIAGTLSGVVGVGGGVVIVPALVLLFGFTQKMAQGTTLALLIPPIGIFAALVYYKAGYVDVKAAALIILGFVIGGYIGSKYLTGLSDTVATKSFGVFLLAMAVKFLFY